MLDGTSAIRNDKVYTYADYLATDENFRCEIIDGVLYLMASPSRFHQEVVKQLAFRIESFLQGKKCELYFAPLSVVLMRKVYWEKKDESSKDETEVVEEVTNPLNSTHVVEPDLFVVCDKTKLKKMGCEGAPDFIIEVLSPSERKKDLAIKRNLYEQNGVREYWTVDIDKMRIIQYILSDDDFVFDFFKVYTFDERVPCAVLEGLEIDFSSIDLS